MANNSKKKGMKFEDKVQKTISSGGLWFNKGDLNYQDFCIECKYTDKKGFRISNNILEKLWSESLDANKEPMLEIGIRIDDKSMFKLQCLLTKERI